ncbi:hypothetical protein IIG_04915 [Bacillus cereus VD048]|uniref:Uncharacterized protein n=1 Tax=Bacillus cereus VD048 TaxID=1053226 RepID=J8HQQ8_BACCE|nr:hypothetical protein [Bacillus cereus]EJR27456.1 hypothetical protein IIG_04915 [Bacillus cereus VD048]
MKDMSKKQIIKVFLISILGLGTMLGILYINLELPPLSLRLEEGDS